MQVFTDLLLKGLVFFYSISGNYGLAIILLTVAINLILYPLTLQSIVQMAALQRIQPKMQELQKKLKDEPQRMQKEIMGLYKSEKVNPLGGCLPTLLKIPFFIGLFFVLQSTPFLEILSNPNNNANFLWINGRVAGSAFQSEKLVNRLQNANVIRIDKKASQKADENQYVWNVALKVKVSGEKTKLLKDLLGEASNSKNNKQLTTELGLVVNNLNDEDAGKILVAWNKSSNLAKPDPLFLLPILIGISTYLMQKSMPTSGAANQQMQMMTYFMPAFLAFICLKFPTGVQVYWLISNAMAAAQQIYIQKKVVSKQK